MKRRIYFNMKSLAEARGVLPARFASGALLSAQQVATPEISGRVSAKPIFAAMSSPTCHTAAMDGYAVKARDTFGASDDMPKILRAADARPVNTGHPLPDDCNAVIMIENVLVLPEGAIEIRQAVYPWHNVRKVGEDIVATELLFPSFHKFSHYDIGALLTGGLFTVDVLERPLVSVIPSGNELVSSSAAGMLDVQRNATSREGWDGLTIVDSNSPVIAAMLRQAGCIVKICDIVADDYQAVKAAIVREVNLGSHFVIINAGSSSGSEDHTANAIDELGEILVHGVTMMPGKPSIIGIVQGKPVLGNPGYPVSAILSIEQLVLPFIAHLHAQSLPEPQTIDAVLSKKIPSRSGLTEFRRLVAGKVGERFVATPLKKGAGSITTLTRANTMLAIPPNVEGLEAGVTASIELLRPRDEVEKTLLCVGSHDLALDLIREHLRLGTPAYEMASGHVGSLGGILALRDKMAHVAGSHLLDPDTGEYNILYIRKYLQDVPVRLINLTHRIQGLMLRKGNPKNIKALEDIVRQDVIYINRQRGAGTRVLLDYHLKQGNIAPDSITGYDNEETTHLAVAAGILSGKADTGMGILSAANALGLDFIPLMEERYDLIIPEEHIVLPMVARLLDIIVSEEFKKQLEGLGGYALRDTGRQLYPC